MNLTSYKKSFLILVGLLSSFTLNADALKGDVALGYEVRDFKNASIKDDGYLVFLGTNLKYDNSLYRATYSYTHTNTKPNAPRTLKIKNLSLKYGHKLNDKLDLSAYYLNVLDDNILERFEGKVYGLGANYNLTKQTSLGLNQFISKYDDFDVSQSDLIIEHKTKFDNLKVKFSSITKYISIDKHNNYSFVSSAKDSYLTSGVVIKAKYDTYRFGLGSYFGKRTFAIMNDGTKVQHHPLEFDETYVVAIGKVFSDLTLKMQYIYLGAKELPVTNGPHVTVKIINFTGSYKF